MGIGNLGEGGQNCVIRHNFCFIIFPHHDTIGHKVNTVTTLSPLAYDSTPYPHLHYYDYDFIRLSPIADKNKAVVNNRVLIVTK